MIQQKWQAIVLLLTLFSTGQGNVWSQGLLSAGELKASDAEKLLTDYIVGSASRPENVVELVVGQGQLFHDDRICESRTILCQASFTSMEGRRRSFLAKNYKNLMYSGSNTWEQRLDVDGVYRFRIGNPTSMHAHAYEYDASDSKTADKRSNHLFGFTAYFLPIADSFSVRKGRTAEDFGDFFLDNFKFVSASRLEGGKILTRWENKRSDYSGCNIVFDSKVNSLPVSTNYWIKDEPISDGVKVPRLYCSMRTSWQKRKFGDVEFWVPVEIKRLLHSMRLKPPKEDILKIVVERIDETSFPKAKDDDWREKIFQICKFDEFGDFKEFTPYRVVGE